MGDWGIGTTDIFFCAVFSSFFLSGFLSQRVCTCVSDEKRRGGEEVEGEKVVVVCSGLKKGDGMGWGAEEEKEVGLWGLGVVFLSSSSIHKQEGVCGFLRVTK